MEVNKKYLTKVCCHPTTFEEIPWRTDVPTMKELAKEEFHVTVLKDFKIEYATVIDGTVKLDSGVVLFDELEGWLPGYQNTHRMRLRDDVPTDVRIWTHDFYQRDPNTKTHNFYDFYHSQRPAIAVLKEEYQIKGGLFCASVVSIEPEGQFKVMGVGGGCQHQYYVGEEFHLRKHKSTRTTYMHYPMWFEVRFPDHDFAEDFRLMTPEEDA